MSFNRLREKFDEFRERPLLDLSVHLLLWMVMLAALSGMSSCAASREMKSAVKERYHETAVGLGARYSFGGGNSYRRANYVLLPSVFYDPKFISVEQRNGEIPEISEEKGSFRAALIIFLLASVYYFWRRWRSAKNRAT